MNEIEKLLQIRYVKLHFTVQMLNDTELPKYKASAIRGGMGQFLTASLCVRPDVQRNSPEDCENCDFLSTCLLRRMKFSKFPVVPDCMQIDGRSSEGYIFECEDYRTRVYEGDYLNFNLLLFGENIQYFSLYLDALFRLGQVGLGKSRGRYLIHRISNSKNENILYNNNIDMSKYEIMTLAQYVSYRLEQLGRNKYGNAPDCDDEAIGIYRIKVKSPLSIKYNKRELENFSEEAFLINARRRLYVMGCFDGIEAGHLQYFRSDDDDNVEIEISETRRISVPRFSESQKQKIYLSGIEGVFILKGINREQLVNLIAGEILHIGKNTSFGFGRYRIETYAN